MRKFLALLKKEILELLTPQLIIPFVIMIVVFSLIGDVVGNESINQADDTTFAVLDLDRTVSTEAIIQTLQQTEYKIQLLESETLEEGLEYLSSNDTNGLLVLEEGFSELVRKSMRPKVSTYANIEGFSLFSNQDIQALQSATAVINESLSNQYLLLQYEPEEVAYSKQPLLVVESVFLNGQEAVVNPSLVIGYVTSQTTFIPIVLFLVITLASQIVATSVASEKENKTLEILLSSPIGRKMIVTAKLLGAGLISLLFAIGYLFSMNNYMTGIVGDEGTDLQSTLGDVIQRLGLDLSLMDYSILALSLFASILVALSAALILGSLVKDTKSAQGIIAPIMMSLLIPYMLTIFVDINSLSTIPRILVNAIPFTHTFTAAPNILIGQYDQVLYGIAYLLVVFVILILVASRLFSSEKLLTFEFKFSFGKK